jgi:hypothetical protein
MLEAPDRRCRYNRKPIKNDPWNEGDDILVSLHTAYDTTCFTHPRATVPVHVTQDRRCSVHFPTYLYVRALDRSSGQWQPAEWWVDAGQVLALP